MTSEPTRHAIIVDHHQTKHFASLKRWDDLFTWLESQDSTVRVADVQRKMTELDTEYLNA
jgi:hypothetical protein